MVVFVEDLGAVAYCYYLVLLIAFAFLALLDEVVILMVEIAASLIYLELVVLSASPDENLQASMEVLEH